MAFFPLSFSCIVEFEVLTANGTKKIDSFQREKLAGIVVVAAVNRRRRREEIFSQISRKRRHIRKPFI